MIRGVDGAATIFVKDRPHDSFAPRRDRDVLDAPLATVPTEREKLTAGIVHDLVELSTFDLMRVRLFVQQTIERARATGTARKLDGATLAREQAEREAPGFGCHHEPACEASCPARSFPPIEGFDTRAEAQEECDAANEPLSDSQILAAAALDWNMRQAEAREGEREGLITLLDLHDASGDRLRVQRDGDVGFLVLGEPDAETVFELGPDAGTRIVGALSDLPAPRDSKARPGGVQGGEAVQPGKAPEKHACDSDCEWCEVPR